MAPEMALGYVTGWAPSAIVTGLHFYLHRKKVTAAPYRLLQQNLKKVDLIWRESQADVEPYREGKEEQDLQSYEKNLLLMGAFFLFLSWGGFIFNLITLLSMHFIAVSRKEQKFFASPLVTQNLSPQEVRAVLADLAI